MSRRRTMRGLLDADVLAKAQPGDRVLDLLLRRDLRHLLPQGGGAAAVGDFRRHELDRAAGAAREAIHAGRRTSRLFVATHMHAGDGNVHTNIPVNSSDYAMLHEADLIVDRVMKLAVSLGGVISGEHGIGMTKFKYLEPQVIAAFERYKREIDPEGHFNRGKLLPGSGLGSAYTPSLRLVQQEALLLEASELGALNDDIRNCLRCGKCKPVCNTHIPRANLLYSPRNKILATGLIIEAFLYEEQTRRGVSLAAFQGNERRGGPLHRLSQMLQPLPGEHRFRRGHHAHAQAAARAWPQALQPGHLGGDDFLNATDPATIKLMRKLMIDWGYRGQRLAVRLARRLLPVAGRRLAGGAPAVR